MSATDGTYLVNTSAGKGDCQACESPTPARFGLADRSTLCFLRVRLQGDHGQGGGLHLWRD